MPMSEWVDSQYFAKELILGWQAMNEEFGNTPDERARLEKCKWRAGELVFGEIQKKLNIPPGDPFTVAKALGDYLTEAGYANIRFHKVSDTEVLYDMGNLVMIPMLPVVRSMGIKVYPGPSTVLFFAAFKKLCNVKAESLPLPDHLKEGVEEDMLREYWRFSPLN